MDWIILPLRKMDGTTEYGSFLDLLSRKAIDVRPLITHVFDITDAEKAYDIVLGKTKVPHIGILLKYKANETKKNT